MPPIQPYQVLFPLGLLHAAWGTILWILFVFGAVPYPGIVHAGVMVGGFLLSFASGFLMTAVPRFTGSQPATRAEIFAAASLSVVFFIFSFLVPSLSYFHATILVNLIFLARFLFARFRRRAFAPPPEFLLIPLGLAAGIAGVTLLLAADTGVLRWEWGLTGKVYLYQGFMLCLVLGVGGKLMPMFLGRMGAQFVPFSGVRAASANPARPPWLAGLLAFSFLLDAFGMHQPASLARALSVAWVTLGAWQIHKRPKITGRLSGAIWLAAWALLLGSWIPALFPASGVHGIHLMFIAGFGLMTILVASRVTLAHGGYDLAYERSSRALLWAGLFIVIAALTRITAPLMPSYYLRHLAYAALVWNAGIAVWACVFVPRIFRRARGGGADAC